MKKLVISRVTNYNYAIFLKAPNVLTKHTVKKELVFGIINPHLKSIIKSIHRVIAFCMSYCGIIYIFLRYYSFFMPHSTV